jgi:hypothetical protein
MTGVNVLICQSSRLALLFILALVAFDMTTAMGFDDRYPPVGEYRHSLPISERYEQIRDTLTTSLKFNDIIKSTEHTVDMDVVRFSRGQKRTTGTVSIHFFSDSTGGWKYLKFHNVSFLVDDERWSFNPEHEGDVGKGYVTESFYVHLTEEQFLRLVNAKRIEIALATDKYSLVHRDRDALKDFASLLNSPQTDLSNRHVGPWRPRTIDRRTIPPGEGVASVDDEERAAAGALTLEYWDTFDRLSVSNPLLLEAFCEDQDKQNKVVAIEFGTRFKVLSIKNRPRTALEKNAGFKFDKRNVEAKILEGEYRGLVVWFPYESVALSSKVPAKAEADAEAAAQAESKLGLAKSHDKDGRKKLAIAGYKEVIDKFPGTSQAEQAKVRLLEIEP